MNAAARRGTVVAGVALLVCQVAAIAADPVYPINVPSLTRPDFLRQAPGETFELPPVDAPATPAPGLQDSATLRFDQVIFRGNTVISTSELEAVAAPCLRRDISAAQLEDCRQVLTKHYIDRGYVNSGVLLATDSSDKTLVFDVVEGRLTGVRLSGMDGLADNYVVQRLVNPGDGPLNMDVLREHFQLLLGDPLFERMNGRLVPGERPGEAFFDVDVVRALPYALYASFNNYLPPTVGSNQLVLNGWVRNLTGQGDLLEASAQYTTEQSAGALGRLAWLMPLGHYGTQLSIAYEQGRSTVIEEPINVLGISGKLKSGEIGLRQSVFESLRHKFTLGLAGIDRESRTYLQDVPFSFVPGSPDGVVKAQLWRFWQDYSYRTESSVLALRSTFSWGKDNLQTIAGLPAADQPDQHFNIWLGQGQYVQQLLENGANLVVKATVQQTPDRLLPIDKLSIGGVYTVRGFRQNQLLRDVGGILNLEFDYPLARAAGKGLNASVIPFYDYGRGKNKGEDAATLSSAGLAARVHWQGFSLDLVIAKRLQVPRFGIERKTTLQDEGVNFQLSYAFF